MLGCLLIGINLILFGLSEWFWINLFGITLIGVGGGLIESSSNPLLIQLFPGRESMVMNLHHFFFALGSLAGPLIMGAVLVRAIPWQWAYVGFGLFALSISLFLLLQRSSVDRKQSSFETRKMKSLLRENTFLLLFSVTFLNAGVQNGITFWMVTFLKDMKGLPISLASYSLFAFFVCLALGRLFSSVLITRINETTYLMGLFSVLLIGLFFHAGRKASSRRAWEGGALVPPAGVEGSVAFERVFRSYLLIEVLATALFYLVISLWVLG